MKSLNGGDGIQTELSKLVSLKPIHILYAVDNGHLALMLRYALERAGHKASWAKDGQQALELMEPDVNFFQLLITDHQMPRMSGLRLVAWLRGRAFIGKIIVHSSALCDRDAEAYRSLGVDLFVSNQAISLRRVFKTDE